MSRACVRADGDRARSPGRGAGHGARDLGAPDRGAAGGRAPAGARRMELDGATLSGRSESAALFAAQVARVPDALAVVHGEERLTYGQLDARANQVARALAGAGVAAGDRVAVALERSTALVVAELAVVKAGAAYVPLDAGAPGTRQAIMVADSGAKVVLTVRAATLPAEVIAASGVRRVDVDPHRHRHRYSRWRDCGHGRGYQRCGAGFGARARRCRPRRDRGVRDVYLRVDGLAQRCGGIAARGLPPGREQRLRRSRAGRSGRAGREPGVRCEHVGGVGTAAEWRRGRRD